MENSMLTGMRALDLDGRITYVNAAFCQMSGFSESELIGRMPPYPYWHPDELEKQAKVSDDVLQGRVVPHGYESRIRHKDGHDVITMIYTAALVDARGVHRGGDGREHRAAREGPGGD